MNINHPSFPQPNDPNVKVWRYMDLAKLVYLLEKKTLNLIRVDCLDDKHEGSIPQMNYLSNKYQLESFELPKDQFDQLSRTMSRMNKAMRCTTYVNCWHMNENESAYMWKLYGGMEGSIAIQSSYKKLSECDVDKLETLYIGKITYINFSSEIAITNSNLLANFMHKHFTFKDEREIRILFCDFKLEINDIDQMNESNPRSKVININPDFLIERIYVNGYAPEWYYEAVKAITIKYLPNIEVIWSNFKSPIYY